MADLKKGLWAPTRGYFELGAAPPPGKAAGGPAPASADAPAPAEDGGAAEVADAVVADELVEASSGGGARVRLWAPTRGYFEHGGAPVKRAAKPAAPKPAAAAAGAASAPKAAAAKPAAAAPAAGPKAAARPAASRAEKAPPPPPKKDPLRDSVTTVPPLVETGVGRALGERIYDEPDSETTLYKVTALNVAFAVSSALLLIYTIIVIYADYNRPWKTIQADYQAKLRSDYDNDLRKVREDQVRSLAALRPSLEQILKRVAATEKLETIRAEAARARASGGEVAAVGVLVGGAKEALDEKEEYVRLREDARKKNIAYTLREKDLRAFKGDFQAEKYINEERKRHALAVHGNTRAGEDEVRRIDAEFTDKFVKKLADLDREVEGLLAQSKIAEQKLAEYVDAESRIAAAAAAEPAAADAPALDTLSAIEGRLTLIEREVKNQSIKVTAVEKDWRTFIRNFPGLDFMAPSYLIDKVVIPDLHEDLNFQTVPRIDRCKTCHVNIENPDPRVASRSKETWGHLHDRWGTVYASHPRLDLFVGSASPHPYEAFGCTTCHYGDGHSTDFVTASHTPGSKEQAEEWEKKYHWHRMHHQDYPMLEKKYVTSSCLKCHPADHKLDGGGNFNLGYEVVKTYGCYGCHKIKAFEGFEKAGPSLAHIADKADVAFLAKWIRNPQHFRESTRMPRFFDLTNSRGQMLVVAGKDNVPETLDFEARNGVEVLALATYLHATSGRREDIRKVGVPGDAARGRELVRTTGCLGCHSIKSESLSSEGAPGNGGAPAADIESLVRAGQAELAAFGKSAEARLADENRKGAKEETRALREGLAASRRLAEGAASRLEALARWYRRLPVGANVEDLHHAAIAALDALEAEAAKLPDTGPPAAGARAAAAAIRDRWVENTFAPDLSSIGSKIRSPDWLADWIIDPRRHDPETVMPRFRLEEDTDGEQKVADIVAYLLTLKDPEFEQAGYLGLPDPAAAAPSPEEAAKLRVLDELAFDYRRRDIRPDQTRDEALAEVQAMTTQAKLEFVGHRLIRRYGCFGCHMGIRDVDSRKEIEEGGEKRIVFGTFDKAQPIGTELEGWGIKEAAKLDYGHWGHQHSGREGIDHSRYAWARAKLTDTRRFDVIPDEKKIAEDVYEYYPTNRLITKTPEELLKMPLFPFVEDEKLVDAAVTFLAALVKDRIPLEKTHRHSETEKALEEGSRLIAKLNCQGCHRIGAEPQFVELSKLPRFSLSFNYDASDESKRRDEFEKETWLGKDLTLKARKVPFDPRNTGEAGPVVSLALPKGTLLNRKAVDKDYPLSVVEAAAGVVDKDSEQRFLGHFDLENIPEGSRVLPVGGYQEGRIRNYFGRGPVERPQAPPPLVREGERVRGDWLFRFLLDVKPLRPWLRVRMPSFYLTQDEARTIVRWFRANAGLPDSNEAFDADRYDHDLALEGKAIFGASVGDKIGYQCNSCHPAGTSLPTVPVIHPAPGSNVKFDYTKFPFRVPEDKHYVVWQERGGALDHRPGFADREAAEAWAKDNLAGKAWAVGDPWDKVKWGPDLGVTAERLRPSWLHDWIAEPQDFMPGTNMPPFFGGRDPVDGIVLKPGSDPKIAAIIRYLVHMETVGSAPSQPAPEAPSGPTRAGGD